MTSARSVTPPEAASILPCRLDVSPGFEAAARYAIEELLRPLGLAPEWSSGENVPHGLWYGLPDRTAPEGWFVVRASPEAMRMPDDPGPIDTRTVVRVAHGGRRIPALFTVDGEADPVADAFFWLSGAQERLSASRDRHGRFTGMQSLQAALGVEDDAPVDDLRDLLADRLRGAGIMLRPRRWKGRPWAFCPTFDVDYARKWRPGIIWRECVQNLLLNYRKESAAARVGRFRQALGDMLSPGDPFRRAMDRIPDELARVGGTSTWFFKAGAHGPHDVAYGLGSRSMGRRIMRLREAGHEPGLHPSYHAHAHGHYMRVERDRLLRATGMAPRAVRMHYLRWQDPETPRLAARLGFEVDSTLAFPDQAGFRHGTTMPFRIWDARKREATGLWEMPLAVMESALFVRLGLGARDAVERTSRLADTARRHGGVLVALWHTTLWDETDYPGWGEHFVETLRRAADAHAAVAGLSDALSSWSPE